MRLDQLLNQRQADAQAVLGTLGVLHLGLAEHVEYLGQEVGGYAFAGVDHVQSRLVAVALEFHADAIAGLGEFPGIVQQVPDDLLQPRQVGANEDRLLRPEAFEGDALGLGQRAEHRLDAAEHILILQRGEVELQLAGADTRDVHQIVDDP